MQILMDAVSMEEGRSKQWDKDAFDSMYTEALFQTVPFLENYLRL